MFTCAVLIPLFLMSDFYDYLRNKCFLFHFSNLASFWVDYWSIIWLNRFFFQEHAFESSQKYKEGKFIIELAHMVKDNQWEDGKKRKSIWHMGSAVLANAFARLYLIARRVMLLWTHASMCQCVFSEKQFLAAFYVFSGYTRSLYATNW